MEEPDEPAVDMQEIEAQIEIRKAQLEQECLATKVDLTASGLDDLDALTIALAIFQKSTPLYALFLGSNSITDEGLDSISGSLAAHPELRELYLGSNLFRDPGVISLTRVLPDLTSLHTLSLSSAHIEDAAATELSSALMSIETCNLKRLYLNQNCISDDGLLSLVVFLSSQRAKLELLHLGDNQFSSSALKLLTDYLEQDDSLEQLFLGDNDIDADAMAGISEGLCANRHLKLLSLANCGIDDIIFKPMLAALAVNETLESLHVWGNFLTDETGELLIDVLNKHNHTLTDLLIFNNPIENIEEFSQVLKTVLLQNKAMGTVDPTDAAVEAEFEQAVREAEAVDADI